jgi:uncharacterized protein YjgD (DUF1641 family)
MANPIPFKPKKIDPRRELTNRLEAAPAQHAEALLVVFDILEEAHNQGLLDLVHGAVGSKNEIAAKLAYYAKQPLGKQALRNLLILGEVLGSLDPVILDNTRKQAFAPQQQPPSMWRLFRQAFSSDGRRGIAILLGFVSGLGKAARTSESSL